MRRESDTEILVEAEKAKVGLRQGIEKSKAVVAQYRHRLSVLRKVGTTEAVERPLFRFRS